MKKFELTGKEVGLLLEAIEGHLVDIQLSKGYPGYRWISAEEQKEAEEKLLSLRRLLSRLTRQLGE
jgi:hypothetical protein